MLLNKKKYKDQIYLDPLTNIYNRRYFEKYAEQWLEREKNPDQYYMYFIFDADKFKQINDVHGHLVGDMVIKGLAHTSHQFLMKHKVIFSRFGGDEFVGFVKLEHLGQMEEIIASLHAELSRIQYDVDGQQYPATVSIGAAALKFSRIMSIDELMKHADDALYESKRNGRNQYTVRSDF